MIEQRELIERFEIFLKRDTIITSPDLDGILSASILASLYGKKIIGFYDGKTLVHIKKCNPRRASYVDMEIFNPDIPSIGNHTFVTHRDFYAHLGDKIKNCINANMIYDYDASSKYYGCKFPFGAIHLLIYLIEKTEPKKLKKLDFENGVWPLMISDGLLNVADKYADNYLRWKDGFFKDSIAMTQLLNFVWKNLSPGKKYQLAQNYYKLLPENKRKKGTSFEIEHINDQKKLDELIVYATANLKLLGLKFEEKNWMILNNRYERREHHLKKKVMDTVAKYKTEKIFKNPKITSAAITERNNFSYTIDKKGILI